MIKDLLLNKTPQEQAKIKSEEIAKLEHRGTFDSIIHNVRVEILSLKAIEINSQYGVEIMARAWKNGKRLGFGDGSVEIERFRVWNPMINVDDPNGNLKNRWTDRKGIEYIDKYREDPIGATRWILSQVIQIHGKEGGVIAGKVGRTTDVFYSSVSPNSPLDGYTIQSGTDWQTVRDATSGSFSVSNAGNLIGVYNSPAVYAEVWRANQYFNTAAIGTDSISSAIFSALCREKDTTEEGHIRLLKGVVSDNSATLVAADYAQANYGTTNAMAADVAFSALAVGSWYNFTISDLTAINKAGITKLGFREVDADINNSAPVKNSVNYEVGFWCADKGTTYIPYLTVVHSAATTGKGNNLIPLMGVG